MNIPPLVYLSLDSLQEGVGASQVLPYVERLSARGVHVRLVTFEKCAPPDELRQRLADHDVEWVPEPFGAAGPRGGGMRLARAVRHAWRRPLVHARSDVAAGAALVARPDAWVWDMRAFWADQRIELGLLRRGSPEERMMRLIEKRSARRASAIVTLAQAAIPVLAARHGPEAAGKARVITTCVDLRAFAPAPLGRGAVRRFLLSGTINRYYDVPLMVTFVERARTRGGAVLRLLTPGPTSWEHVLADAVDERMSASPGDVAEHVHWADVGLSVCRRDAGPSLTAAMPTKVGEFLAAGRPVVASPGLGDLEALLEPNRCGVILRGADVASLDRALDELDTLLADQATPTRCRRVAEEYFDLERGVAQLLEVYRAIAR